MSFAHWATMGFAVIYPVVRYNVFGDVPLGQIPAFVGNKVFCLYASVTILFYAWACARKQLPEATRWMNRTLFAMSAHILLTLALLDAAYYPKLFSGQRMNVWGELAILAGMLAAILYWREFCNSPCIRALRIPFPYALFLVSLHLAVIGWPGWLTPGAWPGGLPPITMICFITSLWAGMWLLLTPARPNNGACGTAVTTG